MFKTVINAFKVKEIRMRLLFTLFCLVIVRIGSNITVPSINSDMLAEWANNQLASGLLGTLTGGALSSLSIFALSISPYINAEIIMQLLTIAIPRLEEMQKDGEDGRQKIQKISRYLTVVLALIESSAMAISFGRSGYFVSGSSYTLRDVATVALAFTAGTVFLMWLGDKITEKGVGNGISVILLINIVARLPQDLNTLVTTFVTGASSVVCSLVESMA